MMKTWFAFNMVAFGYLSIVWFVNGSGSAMSFE